MVNKSKVTFNAHLKLKATLKLKRAVVYLDVISQCIDLVRQFDLADFCLQNHLLHCIPTQICRYFKYLDIWL